MRKHLPKPEIGDQLVVGGERGGLPIGIYKLKDRCCFAGSVACVNRIDVFNPHRTCGSFHRTKRAALIAALSRIQDNS